MIQHKEFVQVIYNIIPTSYIGVHTFPLLLARSPAKTGSFVGEGVALFEATHTELSAIDSVAESILELVGEATLVTEAVVVVVDCVEMAGVVLITV